MDIKLNRIKQTGFIEMSVSKNRSKISNTKENQQRRGRRELKETRETKVQKRTGDYQLILNLAR